MDQVVGSPSPMQDTQTEFLAFGFGAGLGIVVHLVGRKSEPADNDG